MTNVVLLTIDSLRADHCSCYGYDRETTPNIDAFAEDGTRFENAYSPSSHTREAMPALLTGQYPHAAVDESYHLAAPTLATMLAESHHTGAFHSNPFLSRAYGYDQDFDTFDDDLYLSRHKLVALAQRFWDKVRGHHYARAETINERALDWLDSLPDDEPFFLWNHYMDVHGPYEPPEPYRSEFASRSVSGDNAQHLYRQALDDPESIEEEERQLLVDLYDGELRYTDEQVGILLDSLAERGLLDGSLVVVTADHGDGLGDHGQFGHPRYLYDELVEVPLLVNGMNGSTTVSTVPVSGLDIAPTVLSELGMALPQFAGRQLQDCVHEDEQPPTRSVVLEARGEGEDSDTYRYSVRSEGDALTYERQQSETGPDGDDRLSELLREHIDAERRALESPEERQSTERAAKERLEALGYR